MKLYNVQVGFIIEDDPKQDVSDFLFNLLMNNSRLQHFEINSIDIEKDLDKPQKE